MYVICVSYVYHMCIICVSYVYGRQTVGTLGGIRQACANPKRLCERLQNQTKVCERLPRHIYNLQGKASRNLHCSHYAMATYMIYILYSALAATAPKTSPPVCSKTARSAQPRNSCLRGDGSHISHPCPELDKLEAAEQTLTRIEKKQSPKIQAWQLHFCWKNWTKSLVVKSQWLLQVPADVSHPFSFSRKHREGFFRAEPLDKLHRAKLHRAKLQRAKLHRAKLHRAKLHRAKLHRAKLHRPNLHRAKWHRAKLHRAKWHRAKWHRAKLHRARWHRAKWHRAKLQRATEPSGTEPSGTEPSYKEPQSEVAQSQVAQS